MSETKPHPTEGDGAISPVVQRLWKEAVKHWQAGHPIDATINIIASIINRRDAAIADGQLHGPFDWGDDLIEAQGWHQTHLDFVASRTAYNSGLEERWQNQIRFNRDYLANVSLEGLRSMIVIHGATVLATLTIISGQVVSPKGYVLVAAKIMFASSILGLAATAAGFLIIFVTLEDSTSATESRLIRPLKHIRYRSLFRYNRRYFSRQLKAGNYLAYSSVILFILGSVLSGMILLFGS